MKFIYFQNPGKHIVKEYVVNFSHLQDAAPTFWPKMTSRWRIRMQHFWKQEGTIVRRKCSWKLITGF